MPGKTVPGSAAAGGEAGARLKRMRLGSTAGAGCSLRGRPRRGSGLLPPGPAAPGRRCRGDGGSTCTGLEPGGGDVVLPVAHLEPEVAEAALEDGVGAVVEGRKGRRVAAAADPYSVRSPQLLRQVLWQLLVRCSVVPGHRNVF